MKQIFVGSFFLKCFLAVLLSLLAFLIYFNSIDAPFIFDDEPNIENNTYIQLTDLSFDSFKDAAFESPCSHRPLPNISFALNYYFHGYDVHGYHIVNILIHILTGILLFFFIKVTVELSLVENQKLEIGNRKFQIGNLKSQIGNRKSLIFSWQIPSR